MPSVAQLANDSAYASGSTSLTGAGAVRASVLGDMNIVATMQGQRVLTEHLYTVAAITVPMLRALVGYFGVVLRETAKEIHLPHFKTGDTYRSIKSSEVFPLPGGGSVDVFVGTPYSKFLEFGFVHYRTGQWIFNPFMIPAADLVVPEFVKAVEQVAGIVGGRRFLTGMAAQSPANDMLQVARKALYSYSKYAGDIQVLGIGGLSGSRGLALKGARGIGNIQAARQGTIVARATRVVTGKFAGRFGRSGFTSGFSPGSLFTGPSARIYNRLSGRLFGGQLSRIGRF